MKFRKFLAVLSAAAVAASVMPAVFAEDDEELDIQAGSVEYYNEDFSSFSTGTLVDMGSGTNTDYVESNGLRFSCGTRDGDAAALGMQIGSSASAAYDGNYLYAWITAGKSYNNGNSRQPIITLTRMEDVEFNNSVVVGFSAKFANNSTGWILSDGTNELTINIATIANLQTGTWYDFEVASGAESTSIIAKNGDGDVVGLANSTKVLKNIKQIKTDGGGNLNSYLDNLVVRDEEYSLPDDVVLDAALGALAISEGQMGMTVDEGVFHVKRDVALPAEPDGATVEWSVSQRAIEDEGGSWTDTDYAYVSDGNLVLVADNNSENYYVKLTATVTVNDLSDTKDFLFVVEPISAEEAALKYDESFDDFSGTIVNLSKGANTDYKETKGLSFTCGTRDTSGDETGVFGANLSGTDNYIYLCQTKYSGQKRQPVINFNRTNSGSFVNGVYISVDLMFSASDSATELYIQDSSNKIVQLSAPEGHLGEWLHYVVAKNGTGTAIIVYDENDNVISYSIDGDGLSNVAKFTTDDITVTKLSINNLVISDIAYTIPAEVIVESAKANLEITDLTVKDDKYQVADDFELPEAPTGARVSWKAMQKAKGSSEWEDSSLIEVTGLTAVIKPTKDVNDYDVKLVAEITSGEASGTKDFAIALPNPMDEINGILGNNFNVVNTTDTDAEGKTITFDLKGSEMLKRDLILPLSMKPYKNTSIAWSSSITDHIRIDDKGVATLMTSDFNGHEVTLTAVVTYKKNDITYSSDPQKFKVTMGFEADDADSGDETMGKYRVRYDAAYEDNFYIPTSASSNIVLPEDGYFGSEFKWTSSAPTIISNLGKVTKPSTTRTVTLTADIISGSASDTAEFKVTVQGTNSSSSGGGGGGGGGSRTASSTGTINKGTSSSTISTPTSTVTAPATNTSASDNIARLREEALASNDLFTDISKAAWARDAINGLAKAGVVNGKTDTEFYPNDTVTRAEFAKMLMGAFGLASDAYTTSSFRDVPTGEWYFQFVEAAYNLGIIQGTGNGIFEPNALITRQDMAVMVARAALIAGKDLAAVRDMLSFADSGSIASYAAEAVEQLVKAGAMSGKSDTEFAPLENATRAQSAQILFNVVG